MAETATAPETMSAVDAAIVNSSGDELTAISLGDYRRAKAAEAEGKPLPEVAKPGVLGDDEYQKLRARQEAGDFLTDGERKSLRITARAKTQEKVNKQANKAAQKVVDDYEAKLKAKDDEIAQLRRQPAARVAEPPRQAPPAETKPEAAPDPNDATKYPAGIYDPQYIEDKAVWRFKQEQAAAERSVRETQARETQARNWTEAATKFQTTLNDAKSANAAEFDEVITNGALAGRLVPVEEFARLQASGVIPKDAKPEPLNFLASHIIGRSPIPYQLIRHLHQNPAELDRVLAEGPAALYRLEGQLQGTTAPRVAAPSAPAPSPVKTVTDATPPPVALGSRESAPTNAAAAAIEAGKGSLSGGVRDYKAAWRESHKR